MTRWLRLLGVLLALGLVLTACGDDGGDDDDSASSTTEADAGDAGDPAGDYPGATTDDGGDATSGGTEVTIAGFAFDPGDLTVAVGDTVSWTNDDGAAHTVTADDDAFDSGELGGGDTFEQTFDEAGEFAYHCEIHSDMTGTITVS